MIRRYIMSTTGIIALIIGIACIGTFIYMRVKK